MGALIQLVGGIRLERAGISTKMRWGRVLGAAVATMFVACAFLALSGMDDETFVQESGADAHDQDKMAADIWASLGGMHKKAPSLEGDGKGPLPPAPHLKHHAWHRHDPRRQSHEQHRHARRHHHVEKSEAENEKAVETDQLRENEAQLDPRFNDLVGVSKGKAAAKAAAKKGAKKAKAQKKKAAKAKKAAKKAVAKAKAKAKKQKAKMKKKAAKAKKKAKAAAKKAKKKAKKAAKKAKKKAAGATAAVGVPAAGCHKLSGTPFSLCGGGPGGGKGAKKRMRAKKKKMKKKAKALKAKMKKKAKRVKAALKKQKERNSKRKAKETAQKSKNLKRLVAQRRQIKYDKKRARQLKKLNHARDKMYKTQIHALKRLAIPKNHNEETTLVLNKVTKLKKDSAGLDKEESEDGLDEELENVEGSQEANNAWKREEKETEQELNEEEDEDMGASEADIEDIENQVKRRTSLGDFKDMDAYAYKRDKYLFPEDSGN